MLLVLQLNVKFSNYNTCTLQLNELLHKLELNKLISRTLVINKCTLHKLIINYSKIFKYTPFHILIERFLLEFKFRIYI